MTRNNALYFPYINVPSTSWFNRILLYWDQVSSIVPSEYVFNPEKLEPHMQSLVQAGLVEQIIPSKFIKRIPNFGEPFMKFIHHQLSISAIRKPSDDVFSIHIEKLDDLDQHLLELGLARESHWPWYEVDGWVARAFMTYLATALGYQDEINAAPVTFDQAYLEFLKASKIDLDISHEIDDLATTYILLESILPYPEFDYEIDDLLWFKDKYQDQLSAFRNHIELKCSQIALYEAGDRKHQQIEIIRDELVRDAEDIIDAMRSKWRRIVLGSVSGVVSAGLLTWHAIQNPELLNLAGSGVGLIPALYTLFSGDEKYKDALKKPLAYAALANIRFDQNSV